MVSIVLVRQAIFDQPDCFVGCSLSVVHTYYCLIWYLNQIYGLAVLVSFPCTNGSIQLYYQAPFVFIGPMGAFHRQEDR